MSLPLSTCKKCLQPIYWVQTALGKNMPIDSMPVDDGNIIFIDKKAHVHKKGDEPAEGIRRYKSHYATCPYADSFRKK